MNGYVLAGYVVILGSLLVYTLRLRARSRALASAVGRQDGTAGSAGSSLPADGDVDARGPA